MDFSMMTGGGCSAFDSRQQHFATISSDQHKRNIISTNGRRFKICLGLYRSLFVHFVFSSNDGRGDEIRTHNLKIRFSLAPLELCSILLVLDGNIVLMLRV